MSVIKDKYTLKRNLFQHLDGIPIIPSLCLLKSKGIIDYILVQKEVSLHSLSKKFNAFDGYLNVALRMFSSQGWLKYDIHPETETVSFILTKMGEDVFRNTEVYEAGLNALNSWVNFSFGQLNNNSSDIKKQAKRINSLFRKDFLDEDQRNIVFCHLEGIVIGPILIHFAMLGLDNSSGQDEQHIFLNQVEIEVLVEILMDFGFIQKKFNNYLMLTEKGHYYFVRASSYGIIFSYRKLFFSLEERLFINASKIEKLNSEEESHVDRKMNVWASGKVHSNYFKIIDDAIIDIFSRPIEQQPKGILDMGCGNGDFIVHLNDLIKNKTLRGKQLHQHPVYLVGADYNQAAIEITRKNLEKHSIDAIILWGDVTSPELLANDLMGDYQIDLKELLNVRAFIDHNRIWKEPESSHSILTCSSTGAFVFRGARISNKLVEMSLFEHFKNWLPYVEKFGLLIIELHTISPALAAANIGETVATAYDAIHGYSDQYILEENIFNRIASSAGLMPDPSLMKKIPDNKLATVTINLFKGAI